MLGLIARPNTRPNIRPNVRLFQAVFMGTTL